MKNTKNFAAQQLSKKEMNKVKGGDERFNCTIKVNGNIVGSGPALGNSKEEVANDLLAQHQSVYFEDDFIEVRCR